MVSRDTEILALGSAAYRWDQCKLVIVVKGVVLVNVDPIHGKARSGRRETRVALDQVLPERLDGAPFGQLDRGGAHAHALAQVGEEEHLDPHGQALSKSPTT